MFSMRFPRSGERTDAEPGAVELVRDEESMMRISSRLRVHWGLLLGLGVVVGAAFVVSAVGDNSDQQFKPQRLMKPQPPITKVPLQTVAEVESRLNPEELVLGVEIDGHARAYPINMLCGPRREIINDHLGGQSIAATW